MNKQSNIQEDITKDLEKLFKKFDKDFYEYFGKMCPEFNVECIQCKLNLIYNNFKKELWEEFTGK